MGTYKFKGYISLGVIHLKHTYFLGYIFKTYIFLGVMTTSPSED